MERHALFSSMKPILKLEKPKSILLIDTDFGISSPRTKNIFLALPKLKQHGYEIYFLGVRCEKDSSIKKFFKLPIPHFLGPFEFIVSVIYVHLWMIFYWILHKKTPATLTHTTSGMYFFSDIFGIHFYNTRWLILQIKNKLLSCNLALHLPFTIISIIFENIVLLLNIKALLLPVSKGIYSCIPVQFKRQRYKIFPNAYDETKFNLNTRKKFYNKIRSELNFNPDEKVFLFASLGHYERKGFWRAFLALKELRNRTGSTRFLVVGGTAKRLFRLQKQILNYDPNYRKWITFTGTTHETEKYFSAADAFLFPSYFEAFCLAEIECAALGIPLLLTQHPGVEMILKEGVNGLLLPESPLEMALKIESDFIKRKEPWVYDVGEALTQDQYSKKLMEIYSKVLVEKENN